MDICVSAIAFWMCGFAFAFGVDDDGEVDNDFIGWGNFFLEDLEIGANTYAFFFFQFGFVFHDQCTRFSFLIAPEFKRTVLL